MENLYQPLLQHLDRMSVPVDTKDAGARGWNIVTATQPKVRIRTDSYDSLLLVDAYVQPIGLKADWYNYLRAHESCRLSAETVAGVVASILEEQSSDTRPSRLQSEA